MGLFLPPFLSLQSHELLKILFLGGQGSPPPKNGIRGKLEVSSRKEKWVEVTLPLPFVENLVWIQPLAFTMTILNRISS